MISNPTARNLAHILSKRTVALPWSGRGVTSAVAVYGFGKLYRSHSALQSGAADGIVCRSLDKRPEMTNLKAGISRSMVWVGLNEFANDISQGLFNSWDIPNPTMENWLKNMEPWEAIWHQRYCSEYQGRLLISLTPLQTPAKGTKRTAEYN